MFKGNIFVCENPHGVGLMTIRPDEYDCFSFRTFGHVSTKRKYTKPYLNVYIASPGGMFFVDNQYFVTEVLESDYGAEHRVYKNYNQVIIPTNSYMTMFLNNGVLEVAHGRDIPTPIRLKKVLNVDKDGVHMLVRNPKGLLYKPPPGVKKLEMLVLFGEDDIVDILYVTPVFSEP